MATTSPGRDAQVDVVQYLAPFVAVAVAEMHMLEADALVEGRQHDSIWLLVDVVAGIKEVEDRRRSADSLLEVVVELGELPDWIVELENRHDEGEEDCPR